MTRMRYVKALLIGCSLALGTVAAVPVLAQQDGQEEGQESQRAKSLDPRVAKQLMGAYEDLQNDRYADGVAKLDDLLASRGDAMKPFDLASVLQIRGSALANLERYDAALDDFQRALELGALPEEQNVQLRFNVAQLHFRAENYGEAIRHLRLWIEEAEKPDHKAHYMLAAAHYYREEYREAVSPVQRAIELSPKPSKRYYELANIIYAQAGLDRRRVPLLKRMVEYWPDEKTYWKQLAAVYNQTDQQRKSFSTLEVAYRNGLIDEADDILSLAQFYSVYNNPHRGAELLVKEMERGRVERSVDNLELLSQLWSQAREHKKAIPVLREAARKSDTGELSYRLGQVLLADEQNEAAARALEAAVNKGGLPEAKRADAWMLLGTARFNQAGPGDREQRAEADAAFAKAQRFEQTRKRAKEWRGYIAAINRTESRQASLEAKQEARLAEAARQRQLTSCRAQRLSGAEVSDECEALFRELAEDGGDDAPVKDNEGDD